ncbi:TetR/AcrR family transcriptional regulator [Streptosporangiaceae bacterium NEAU-GS5]|nr:TetR/AcrR family transcriptional regulator [Streptosporangiaceae bacterium NEAU-GS5]
MARVVDEEEHRAKRAAILDFAAGLVQSKGYEKMTIQDVLDGLGISRGALYHYFDSKQALLQALVDRMGTAAAETLLPIVADPGLTALEKFQRYVAASSRLKADRRELIIGILRTWYADENALFRQKITDAALTYTAPMIIEPIIRQGIAEGVFDTAHPEAAARIIVGIFLTAADSATSLLLADAPDESVARQVREVMDATTEGVERILGAPPGSLRDHQVDRLLGVTLHARAMELDRGEDDTR